MEIGELMTWWAAKAATLKPSDAKGFYRYVMMQKLRTGVVLSTLRKTVSSSLPLRFYRFAHR
jgi:hypothetical protein